MTSTALTTEHWYTVMIEDCKDIIVETEFTSRWVLVEGYHALGKRILEERSNFERSQIYGQGLCNTVAESLGKSKRTIEYAIQFARTYPDLNLLPAGKNVSWHKIINKYLVSPTGEAVPKAEYVICPLCSGKFEFNKRMIEKE